MRDALGAIPGVRVMDRGTTRCAIVTMTAEGRQADPIVRALNERGINAAPSLRETIGSGAIVPAKAPSMNTKT